MLGIKEFFKNIQNKHTQELFVRSVVQEGIRTHTGASVPLEAIQRTTETIVLKGVASALRSAVYIKKSHIIGYINEHQTIYTIVDIR